MSVPPDTTPDADHDAPIDPPNNGGKKSSSRRDARGKKQRDKAKLEVESLEARIMLSGTWVDADTGAHQSGATSGDDAFYGSSGNDIADGGDGADQLFGGDGDDQLFGGDGDDQLFGDSGADQLSGGSGNDLLQGGADSDVIDGGSGTDVVSYSNAGAGVTVDITDSTAQDTGGGGSDTLTSIEGVIGSDYDDTFSFANASDGDCFTVDGGAGSNTIDLSNHPMSDVTVGETTITVDLGGGESFTIDYENVDTIEFSDGPLDLDPDSSFDGAEWSVGGDEDTTIAIDLSNALPANGDQVVSVTITGVPDGATLSAGQENPDGSWTLTRFELADVSLTPAADWSGDFDLSIDVTTATSTAVVNDSVDGTNAFTGSHGVTVTARNVDSSGNLTAASADNVHASSAGISADGSTTGPSDQLGYDASAGVSEQVIFEFHQEVENATIDVSRLYANEGSGGEQGRWVAYSNGTEVGSSTFTPDSGSNMTLSIDLPAGQTFDTLIFEATEYEDGQNGNTSDSSDYYVDSISFEYNEVLATETFTSTCSVSVAAVNDAAVVDAGPDQTVDELSVVSLAGSATDVEGDALTYTWVQTGGPTVTLDDPSSPTPTFTAPGGISNSEITFELQVSDGTEVSTDEVSITVNADNDAPTAEAGADQTVPEGNTVTLAGSGTDPEGSGLTYTWVQTGGPTVTLDDPNATAPSFTAPDVVSSEEITFELQVSDGDSTSIDTVTVTVTGDNDGPTADAGTPQTVDEGDTVTLAGSGSDPEGQTLTYTWVQTGGPTVTLDDPNAASPSFTAPEGLSNSDVTFELQVSDGTNTATDTVTVTVNADNDAPTADAGSPQTVDEGDTVTLTGSGVDPEGEGLTYTWVQTGGPTVTLDDPNSTTPTFTAPEGVSNSDVTFELQVSDGTNTSVDTVAVTVNADNDAPTADAGSPQTVDEGDTVTLTGSGVDPEGEGLTYTWVQTGGPTVTLDDPNSTTPTFTAPEGVSNSDVTFELQVSDGTNTSVDTVAVTVNADNDAPTADAGTPQTVNEGDTVTLTGSGVDPEGEGLTYTWVQTGGPTVTLDDPNSSTPSFTAPEGTSNEDVTFELQVSDGTNTSVDTVTVSVNADNDGPSADAGTPQTVDEGDTVTLAGTGTDPEGDSLTYTWVQTGGPTVTLDDPNAASPSFTAPEGLSNSDVTFELQVSDGTNTATDTVTVTVNADNDAPTADAGSPQTVDEGDTVTLTGSGVDPEGEGLTYTWVQTGGPTVTLDDPNSTTPSFTAPEGVSNSDVTFELQVSDGTNTSVDTVAVTVNADNDAPTADAGSPQTVNEGDAVTLTGSGVDPEGDGLTYTWVQTGGPTVTLDDPNSTTPTFTAPEGVTNSDVTFELQVSDGTNTSVDTVTVTVNADNDAPTADAGSPQTVDEGDTVTLTGSGVDPEGEGLTYTWVQTGGPTVTLDDPNSTTPTFTAPEGVSNSDITFELQVSDGTNTSVDTATVTVNADNDAPTADAGSPQTVDEGDTVTLTGSGVDPEGEGLTYTWVQTGGPTVTLDDPNSTTPTFTAPEGTSNEDVTFELQVSDGTNTSVDTVTVSVNADNDGPSADAGTPQTVDEGDTVTLAGTGTDPEGDSLTYTWVQTGGPTVTLDDPSSAAPSFTAPEGVSNSDITFELQVSDGTNTATDTVTVTVNADNDAPTADAGSPQTVDEGDTVTLTGSGVDPEGEGLTYTWVQTGGPTVTLDDPNSTTPTFTAPEGVSNSDVTFELQVSDGTNTSVDTVAVTVNADNDAPTADAGSPQTVNEGDAVTLTGSGVDPEGEGLTYTWVQTGGPTVTLDDPNSTTPTFTAPEGVTNSDVTFELQVSDGTNTSVDTVTVTVNADNDAPTADAGSPQSANEGDTVTLAGSGTDPEGEGLTYTWVQTGGPTVTLDDPNSTTPSFTAPEGVSNSDVTFELQVSDGTNTSVDTVAVTVNADNDAPTADAGSPQTVDEGDTVTLTGSGVDPEGEGLTYTWVQTGGPTVTLDDPNSTTPTFTAPEGVSNSDVTFELQVSDGTNTSVDTVAVTVNADNDAPTADAGTPQTVNEGDTVTLTGSGVDPEGEGLTYTWVQTGGPTVTLDDPNSSTPSFTAPEGTSNEDVTFELQVSDGTNTSVDTVTVSVNADNDGPSADAGTPQTVDEGDTVTLAGTGTDPEGDSLTYTWVQTGGPTVTLDDPNAASPSFTAPEGLSNSDVTFELQVSDGTNTATDTVTVTVNADNDAPTADAGSPQTVDEGDTVTLTGSGVDPEGEGLTYTWVQTGGPTVTLDDPNSSTPSFTAPEGTSNEDVTFELQVSDGTNTSVDTVTVSVNADNDGPSADAGTPQTVDEGDTVTLAGTGTDPEGDSLTYTWVQTGGPTVTLDDPSSAAPSFTAPEGVSNSDITFELQVSDGTNTATDTVTVTVNADNDAPTADAGSPQTVDEGDTVTLTGSGVDPEGEGLTYTWVQTGGPTVTLDDPNSTTPTFTAPEGVSNSDVTFELQVSDGTNTSVDTVAVTVNADNDAPTADAGSPQTVNEGDAVTLTGSGVDPEGDGLTYTWVQTGGPTVTLDDPNSTTPTFTAPEGVSNSDITFELQVSDGNGTSVDTVTIAVNADDDAPTADAGPTQTVEVGDVVTLAGSGVDPEGAGLSFEWVQISGPTVTLDDPNSATPSFTVPEASDGDEIRFELRVSDGTNTSVDTASLFLETDNQAPVVQFGGSLSGDPGDVIDLGGPAFDPDGDDLTYRWTQVDGPSIAISDATSSNPSIILPDEPGETVVFRVIVSDGETETVQDVVIAIGQPADDDTPTDFGDDARDHDDPEVDVLPPEYSEDDLAHLMVFLDEGELPELEAATVTPTAVETLEAPPLEGIDLAGVDVPDGYRIDIGSLTFEDVFVEEVTLSWDPEVSEDERGRTETTADEQGGDGDGRDLVGSATAADPAKLAWLWGLIRGAAGSQKESRNDEDRR